MKTIGIIGAMPSELADIREALESTEIVTLAKYEFHVNHLHDKKIISVCCGIGKVNAAVCTQVLIDHFAVDCIINTGIAGGLNTAVKVCDIVVSKNVMHHDLLPRMLENYPPFHSQFDADEHLIEQAVSACKAHDMQCFTERIVSGEAFVSSTELRDAIIADYAPYAVDMETAAIAHCAYRNDIPFVSVRCISDNANEESDMSFEEFEKIAAKRVATIVLEMADKI